jgi:hypothetical protein
VAAAAILVGVGISVAGAASPAPSSTAIPSSAAVASPSPSPSLSPSPAPYPTASAPAGGLSVIGVPTSGTIANGGEWSIVTPELVGPLDPAILAAVNGALIAGRDDNLAFFRRESGPSPTGISGIDQLTSDWSLALLTPELLSLRVEWYFAPAWAAHGIGSTEGWTFDLAAGRRLALTDLFLPGADVLHRLTRLSRSLLAAQLDPPDGTRHGIRDGTMPLARNFDIWTVTPAGLELTFDYYQVGPYAIGKPLVVIPWERLADLLDPTGSAASLRP